jgi:hypothetical protein
MCFIILLTEERLKQAEARWRRRCPRLASWWFGPQGPPPLYDDRTSPLQSQAKPIAKRPDSLTLYGGYRKRTASHNEKEMKDLEKAVTYQG